MPRSKVRLQSVPHDLFVQPRPVTVSLEMGDRPAMPPLRCVVTPAGPVQVDLFLPLSCGLQRRSLRDAVTGEVLASQEPGQVDLSRLSRDGIMLLQM